MEHIRASSRYTIVVRARATCIGSPCTKARAAVRTIADASVTSSRRALTASGWTASSFIDVARAHAHYGEMGDTSVKIIIDPNVLDRVDVVILQRQRRAQFPRHMARADILREAIVIGITEIERRMKIAPQGPPGIP